MIPQLAGLIWISSAVHAGLVVRGERGGLRLPVTGGAVALAVQTALAFVVLGTLAHCGVHDATAPALAISVPAFWGVVTLRDR